MYTKKLLVLGKRIHLMALCSRKENSFDGSPVQLCSGTCWSRDHILWSQTYFTVLGKLFNLCELWFSQL